MTPLRLELSGFTCFREVTAVDFSDLDLFAISGPTGSGKSTLLDALTYALYGQTARLGSKGLDVLISPGLMQMFVVLEFKNAQGTFRVTRTADRKPSGKIDRNTRIEVLQADASYKQLAESEKLKEADQKLEQLVGLDYDGFTRSVMLPQGAFDEFLRGDATKRRKLLVGLLGLDKVEQMQKEAGRVAKDARAHEDNITERLEQDYAGATPEKRCELEAQLETIQSDLYAFTQRQIELSQALKESEEVKTLLEEKAMIEGTLEHLRAQSEDVKVKKNKLELARRAQLIAPQIEHLGRLEEKLKASKESLDKLTALSKQQETKLVEVQTEHQILNEKITVRIPEIEEKLNTLTLVTPLMSQLTSRGGSLDMATTANEHVIYTEEAWSNWQEKQSLVPAFKQSQQGLEKTKGEIEEAKSSLKQCTEKLASLEVQKATLIEEGKTARAAFEKAKVSYDDAIMANQAALLSEHLHEGEACPVCEQIVKRMPGKKEHPIEGSKQNLLQAETDLDKVKIHYRDIEGAIKIEIEQKNQKLQQVAKLEQTLSNQSAQVTETLKPFGKVNLDELEADLSLQKKQLLAALALDISKRTENEDPEASSEKLRREKQDLEVKQKQYGETLQSVKSRHENTVTRLELITKQFKEDVNEQAHVRKGLEQALQQAGFDSDNEAKAAVMDDGQIEQIEAELASYSAQKEASERRDLELQGKLTGRTFDGDLYDQFRLEQTELKQQLSQAQTLQGRVQQELETIKMQLERARELEKERAKYRQAYDTFRQLSLDLRGNEFQEFLLSQVQSKLAYRASHILREVTDGRYNLRLIDGDYQVIDAWNTSEIRNARTLSGGETFITSLALALALSDTIAGSHALGALFLDEGFGTLDALTLDSVAQVLENLTREGRMVGIITHVTALTERLPARLSVSKGQEGSRLSWDI